MQGNNCGPPMQSPQMVDNPCAYLPGLRMALYELLSGKQKTQVRFGDQWVSWSATNTKELRAEITKLETMCQGGMPNHRGRAERVGPRFNPSTFQGGYGYGRSRNL
jgi:hypothetical protein